MEIQNHVKCRSKCRSTKLTKPIIFPEICCTISGYYLHAISNSTRISAYQLSIHSMWGEIRNEASCFPITRLCFLMDSTWDTLYNFAQRRIFSQISRGYKCRCEYSTIFTSRILRHNIARQVCWPKPWQNLWRMDSNQMSIGGDGAKYSDAVSLDEAIEQASNISPRIFQYFAIMISDKRFNLKTPNYPQRSANFNAF